MNRRPHWNDAERFAFATQKLRAQRIPDKKKQENKRACRKFNWQ